MTQFWLAAAACSMVLGCSQPGEQPGREPGLRLLSNQAVSGGIEIIAFDSVTRTLLGVGGDAQCIYSLSEQGIPTLQWSRGFTRRGDWTPTSIAVDPAGRGFAAVTWLPSAGAGTQGYAQFIDIENRTLLGQMPVGEHPDCVAFTPDGRYLLVANENEVGQSKMAGGLTVVDLSGVQSVDGLRELDATQRYGFEPRFLADGGDLSGLRISADSTDDPTRDIEPEYLAPTNEGVWVSLQENNALAYFDFKARLWTRVLPLGTLTHPFDADDKNGASIGEHASVPMLLQPDTIKLVEYKDGDLLLLANEGEHGDDDIIRLRDAMDRGLIDPGTLSRLNAEYGDARSKIGRLTISTIDGDTDGDGDIDVPTAIGARGISLIDAGSGERVWDSGDQMERVTARYPDLYNGGDTRSDRGGPEPEGLAVGRIGGHTLAFVGLERTDVIMMYDISDPAAPRLLATQRLESACSSPEGLVFIDDGDRWFLGVASEENGCLSIYEIHIGG